MYLVERGVSYEHYLETKYLNDMWELTVIMSDDGLNRSSSSSYLFEWSQVDRRSAVDLRTHGATAG